METIQNPAVTTQTRDLRHLPGKTGDRRDEPAVAYITTDDSYVVVNMATGEVIAISDRTDPGWRMPNW